MGVDVLVSHDIIRGDPKSRKLEGFVVQYKVQVNRLS